MEILYYFHNFHLNLKKNKKTKCKIFDKVPTVTIKMCSERQKQDRQKDRQTDRKSHSRVPSHESLDSTKCNGLIGLFNPDQADS